MTIRAARLTPNDGSRPISARRQRARKLRPPIDQRLAARQWSGTVFARIFAPKTNGSAHKTWLERERAHGANNDECTVIITAVPLSLATFPTELLPKRGVSSRLSETISQSLWQQTTKSFQSAVGSHGPINQPPLRYPIRHRLTAATVGARRPLPIRCSRGDIKGGPANKYYEY
uniref:Uncharacterized protein n=1 Tax=Plectus sambesii TaxID=2011161 RepID=A0A914V425_9BILA